MKKAISHEVIVIPISNDAIVAPIYKHNALSVVNEVYKDFIELRMSNAVQQSPRRISKRDLLQKPPSFLHMTSPHPFMSRCLP